MKKIGLISLSLILILVVVAIISCSGNKKAPARSKETQETTVKVTEGEEKLEEDSANQTESSSADETSDNSTEDASTEATTIPATKEETTTKPVVKEEETTKPKYTYKDMNAVMYAKSSVNVRSLPSTEGSKEGSLKMGQEVKVTGQCNETGWYRIEFSGKACYVSNNYLVSEKPVETKTESATKPSVSEKDEIIEDYVGNISDKLVRYTAADKVGDGLDSYRIGQFKYGILGKQLHVLTTDENNRYGFYFGTDDYSREWNDLSVELQHDMQEVLDVIGNVPDQDLWGKDLFFPTVFLDIEQEIIESEYPYNEGFLYCTVLFEGRLTASGNDVYVDNTQIAKDIMIYALVSTINKTHYQSNSDFYVDDRLYKGNETIEEILQIEGFTLDEYKNGEKWAKKYGIDFHDYITNVEEHSQWNISCNEDTLWYQKSMEQ